MVGLGYLCVISVGFGRLAATWDVNEFLPDSFSGKRGEVHALGVRGSACDRTSSAGRRILTHPPLAGRVIPPGARRPTETCATRA